MTMNNPTATDALKSNLGEAGSHLKSAAAAASEAIRGAAGSAGDELKLGKANVKSELADSALSALAAGESGGAAAMEQVDQLMDKGRDLIDSVERYITLEIIDNEWKEHLREMDDLRRNVQNASIEQKDPLLIYKLESFKLFDAMVARISGEVVSFLVRAGLPSAQPQIQQAQAPRPPQQKLQSSAFRIY
jgi:preprotein translocase subunit SecA